MVETVFYRSDEQHHDVKEGEQQAPECKEGGIVVEKLCKHQPVAAQEGAGPIWVFGAKGGGEVRGGGDLWEGEGKESWTANTDKGWSLKLALRQSACFMNVDLSQGIQPRLASLVGGAATWMQTTTIYQTAHFMQSWQLSIISEGFLSTRSCESKKALAHLSSKRPKVSLNEALIPIYLSATGRLSKSGTSLTEVSVSNAAST